MISSVTGRVIFLVGSVFMLLGLSKIASGCDSWLFTGVILGGLMMVALGPTDTARERHPSTEDES